MINKTRVLLFLAVPFLLTGCLAKSEKYDNVDNYKEYLAKAIENSDFHTELYIFPSEISKDSVKNFIYRTKEGLLNGDYFFYLVMEYDETTYSNEIERLSNVKATFKEGTVKSVLHNEEKKVYLTIQQNGRNEYAYYDESKHQIAYVSNQLFDWGMTGIDKEHYIDNVPIEEKDRYGGYNIYYRYEGDVGYYIKDN